MSTDARPGMAAVVLAAGGGSRFTDPKGRNKLLVDWRGQPLVTWAAQAALASGCSQTWVVTGAADLAAVLPNGVEELVNPRWHEGQASSLQVAVSEARRRGLDAVVVGLGDQPGVPSSAWRLVASTDGAMVVATYEGRRRNPVKLTSAVWELLPATGDQGARSVLRGHPELVTEVGCAGNPDDIDTVEDLRARPS
ncbi:MAG: nucleotidyltransferase family protein [Acidimicrobiales bacterium]